MQIVTVKKPEALHRKPKPPARQLARIDTRIDMRATSKFSLAKIGHGSNQGTTRQL